MADFPFCGIWPFDSASALVINSDDWFAACILESRHSQ
jgi:hypothetical protein